MAFNARYGGRCADCGGPIAVGQTIERRGRRAYRHADCEAQEQSHKARYGRCEDAPCCGCGGACGTPLGYGSDYSYAAY